MFSVLSLNLSKNLRLSEGQGRQISTSQRWLVLMLLIALIMTGCQGGRLLDQPADSSSKARVELPPGVSETQHAGDFGSHYDARQPGDLELQRPSEALSGFPRTRLGEVDWVAAMEEGLINPRKGLQDDMEMEVLDLDVIMPRVKGMAEVLFSHQVHTEWLGCESCHDHLFARKAGVHRATMNDIFAGKSCGTCHDRVAFSTYTCDSCHSVAPGKD